MKITGSSLEAITVALLAVYQWPAEKVWKLLPALREAGLTDPARTAGAGIEDVIVRLANAGYDRGLLTEMFALRVMNLMAAARDGVLDDFDGHLRRKDKAAATEVLVRVKGIGPKVAETAWMLLADAG